MLHKQFSENSPKNIRLRQCSKKLIHCSVRSFFPLWQKKKIVWQLASRCVWGKGITLREENNSLKSHHKAGPVLRPVTSSPENEEIIHN